MEGDWVIRVEPLGQDSDLARDRRDSFLPPCATAGHSGEVAVCKPGRGSRSWMRGEGVRHQGV